MNAAKESKIYQFPDGKIEVHYDYEGGLAYMEIMGWFVSSVRTALYPDSIKALKEVFKNENL